MDRRAHLPEIAAADLSRLDVPAPRYTSYPTVPEWVPMAADDTAQALALAGQDSRPIDLYVHVPFCAEMCSFCGCHVIVSPKESKVEEYVALLGREAWLASQALHQHKAAAQLHLGGGTPTYLDERQLELLLESLRRAFDLLDTKMSVEVDPAVTRRGQLEVLAWNGFTRMSVGVQDLDPRVQEAVCRLQSEAATRAVIDDARALGFTSVNVDLIYGLPRQTPESFTTTLRRVIAMRPERVSLFSFAHVPAVKPHQRRLPVAELPQGMDKHLLYRFGHDALVDAGYVAVGMDHFALPDDELALAADDGTLRRDFQGYSPGHASAGTLGLGASGISDLSWSYWQNVKTLPRYAAAIQAGELPVERGFRRSPDDERRRAIIAQLMCSGRVVLDVPDQVRYADELLRLSDGEFAALCTVSGGTVELSTLGRVFVRNVAAVFDAFIGKRRSRVAFSKTV